MKADSIKAAKRTGRNFLVLFFLGRLAVSCGAEHSSQEEGAVGGVPDSTVVVTAGAGAQARTKFIPASLEKARTLAGDFSLVSSATSYSIQMSGCLSGFSGTVTQANADGLEVYKYDRGCLAKLSQFVYNGRTYLPTAGSPFTTWQAGDYAMFDEAFEPGIAPLHVAVMSTLGNPITGVETIKYVFSELLAGSGNSILWVNEGTTGNYVAGNPVASSFSVRSTQLTGLTAGEGGKFKFVLECASTIGATNVCESYDFTGTDYKLIADTYSSAPTNSDLSTIFGSAGTSVTLPADRVAPGDQGTTNGGYITVELNGPDNMATNPNMLLVIRSGTSYHYLNVDVMVSASY